MGNLAPCSGGHTVFSFPQLKPKKPGVAPLDSCAHSSSVLESVATQRRSVDVALSMMP
jgi:hypothetical protein